MTVSRGVWLLPLVFALGCNGDNSTAPERPFLEGTSDNPEIALVINSIGKALTMFQLGDPDEQREIPFGTSTSITPTGLAVSGTHAIVPMGDAASVAIIDLESESVERFLTLPSGNATGVAFTDNGTFLVANLLDDYVAKGTIDQAANDLAAGLPVAPAPTAIVVSGGRAFVVSGNLDESYAPLGNGIVTVVDPVTMTVVDEIETGGTNSSAAAVGSDGKLYILNTGNYVDDASITIINPTTLAVEMTVPGFPPGAGSIRIDQNGLAYLSVWNVGTVVWNTATRTFVRGFDNPVCAKVGSVCRGAFDANRAADGSIYQAFTGSASDGLAPYVFIYAADTYELVDSVAAGVDPSKIEIATFGAP